MKTLKTTILGGLLFLAPLVVLIFILSKAFEFSRTLAVPLGRVFPMDRIAGVALSDILAVGLILFVSYLAGLVARGKVLAKPVARIERVLISVVPGYAVLKSTLAGLMGDTSVESLLQPVLIRLDDVHQIAFEVERLDDRSVVFLPGAPSAWSGTSVIVDSKRVTYLSVPPHQVTGLLRVLGRGTGKLSLDSSAKPD
ncbi:hypothetical protein QO034_09510 [Sedimentitalea sp. JM2-8]|uniref:DUF502 domain-containing protein n=1 Tax=Sedimentitalea xiamensis TaxID=3050037 RepID=A0ABT7FDZ6_9RHOB|nr:hypothetical protein [Sedimentitalea xiamensis]MDK3073345.1 hypothetical protein [Sedimentitalea xiamensis]